MICTDFSAISICFIAVRFDIALNKHILCVAADPWVYDYIISGLTA